MKMTLKLFMYKIRPVTDSLGHALGLTRGYKIRKDRLEHYNCGDIKNICTL